jgi:cholesterol transport system auxiliary component
MCLGLAGCALGGSAAPTTYDLVAPRSFAPAKGAGYQLVVAEPTTVQALDTNRIMIRPRADQISYYKGVAWSDRLPHLYQVRMIETLQNSGAVKAVFSSNDRADGEYTLATEVRAFQIDNTSGHPSADVDVFAKLINNDTSKVVASKGFTARVASASDDPAAGVAALNQR